ncbi:MAG: metallophosphoesterase [Hydrogenophaga sp.]|jgi:predicted phosphodiesterase|uniref:metallophosphoesterase n=1 Tax=Hydrogenophaga sp. TaxID=1904254 RepID=UPI002720D840|nr:metallophosphoesterase [Hydrogenophaga sp.]MDO9483091.1 metallophosphoesterase [Hydrogenophaga sp.]MDO9568675.1 metallophosphoesterase [Hydrogenophaga sp.]MDP2218804.1 metallophosphoesterase [Hydrogenophaga sp.]MDP3374347.1 metallophosphoesterase [Hydrogenophaga sp.]MDZ4239886.1 metallophosphoesterase [Hydrogenophaga sp.]
MNIQLLSDLHLEANPEFMASPAPGAHVLVLAGDIGSYQHRRDGGAMDEPDWGLQRFSPLPQYAGWPVPVLFVPGNHEYDALDVDEAHQRLRATCERLGIAWLERETLVVSGVRFVGTTLWSDYDALGGVKAQPAKATRSTRQGAHAAFATPTASAATDPLTHRLRQREKAFRAANFYLTKMAGQRHGRLFDAEAMRALALECQHWLRNTLAQPFDGPTVVVTHFAPTLHSADPRYGLSPGTAGFCNGLDDLLPMADLWLHGHLHCPTDVQVGRCRIVANPLGYAEKQEQQAFVPQRLIPLP